MLAEYPFVVELVVSVLLVSGSVTSVSLFLLAENIRIESRSQRQPNLRGNKHIPSKAGAATEAAMAAFAPTLNVSFFLSPATRIDPNSLRGVPGRWS